MPISKPRPRIMGILNLTPDSFSDGGKYNNTQTALTHAQNMVNAGAEIIDVGAESTRPYSVRVPPAEQIKRIGETITTLRDNLPKPIAISIDTTHASVAEHALNNGATMINDISAGIEDPNMLALAASRQVPICLMHMQGTPETMQDSPHYEDPVKEIKTYLLDRAKLAEAAGILKHHIFIDPGIGFGKTKQYNLILLSQLAEFVQTGYQVLLGTSKKRFLDSLSQNTSQNTGQNEMCSREISTLATTVLGVVAGVVVFRVHNVRENRQAADAIWAILNNQTS